MRAWHCENSKIESRRRPFETELTPHHYHFDQRRRLDPDLQSNPSHCVVRFDPSLEDKVEPKRAESKLDESLETTIQTGSSRGVDFDLRT